MEKVVLVGLGAIGAAYASRFADAGADLRVLAGTDRRARYAAQPTVVNGQAYDFALSDGSDGPADLAIVAVKRAALDEAIELLRPCVREGTVLLSVMNGIDTEEELEADADELLATFAPAQASDTDLPSRPRERLRPGARPAAISAASIASVPEPHIGFTKGVVPS